jgi:integrase
LLDLLVTQHDRVRDIEHQTGKIIPWVFVYPNGSPIRSYRHAWANACRAAGVPGRLVHDLRRTAARAMIRSGIPQTVAMKLTGRETDTIFRRYAIVDAGMLREAAHKLDIFRRGTIGAQLGLCQEPRKLSDKAQVCDLK